LPGMSQTPIESLTQILIERNINYVKAQLFTVLMNEIRKKGWNQAQVAAEFNVSQPRISNLFNEHLEKFSIDKMLDMLVRCGYILDADANYANDSLPLVMNLKKSLL
jgi:predicted XRE-type DNA-binding protein